MKKNRKLATQNPSLNFRHFEEKKPPQKKRKNTSLSVHENPNRCTRKERRGILRVIRWAAHSYLRLSISVKARELKRSSEWQLLHIASDPMSCSYFGCLAFPLRRALKSSSVWQIFTYCEWSDDLLILWLLSISVKARTLKRSSVWQQKAFFGSFRSVSCRRQRVEAQVL